LFGMKFEKTFSEGSQLLTIIVCQPDDFIRTKKYTRVSPACIFKFDATVRVSSLLLLRG
jgi:hypothetical protein